MKPGSYTRSNNPSAESKKHVVELLSTGGLSAERDKEDNHDSPSSPASKLLSMIRAKSNCNPFINNFIDETDEYDLSGEDFDN